MSEVTDVVYPFDPTGSKSTNLIINERQTLTPPPWKDYHFIIPKFAPFFRDSLEIRRLNDNKLLIEGEDWVATHHFIWASRNTAKPVYGSISFFDKTLTGIVEYKYQTLGGEWLISEARLSELLIHKASNPRITNWEQVVDLPYAFPVIDHTWNIDDLVGARDLRDAIDRISQTLVTHYTEEGGGTDFSASHHLRFDNPHGVDKFQIDLGHVQNFPMATYAEALEGTHGERYMSPLRTKEAIVKYADELLVEHHYDIENPHQVTKAQVGLSLVLNYPIAERYEAEEGVSDEKYMTPLKTKEAITAIVKEAFEAHQFNYSNPHQVTKTQIGLEHVENYTIGTEMEAQLGVINDVYMTPLLTRKAVEYRLAQTHLNRDQVIEKLDQVVTPLTTQLTDLEESTYKKAFINEWFESFETDYYPKEVIDELLTHFYTKTEIDEKLSQIDTQINALNALILTLTGNDT